jgi:hypothetical protein
MVMEYPKSPRTITDGHKIYQQFPIQGTTKFTQIEIFGLKKHLATLLDIKMAPIKFQNASPIQVPIRRLLNLQLQRQRCSTLERFLYRRKIIFVYKRAMILVAL